MHLHYIIVLTTQWEPFKGSPRGSQQRALSFRDYSSNSERAKHHFVCVHACVWVCVRVCGPTPSEPQAVISPSQEKKGRELKREQPDTCFCPLHKHLISKDRGTVGEVSFCKNSESTQQKGAPWKKTPGRRVRAAKNPPNISNAILNSSIFNMWHGGNVYSSVLSVWAFDLNEDGWNVSTSCHCAEVLWARVRTVVTRKCT